MTTDGGHGAPAGLRLAAGSWVGLAGVALTLAATVYVAIERRNDRMAAEHREFRAAIAAVGARMDARVDVVAADAAYTRGQLDVVRGQLDVVLEQLDVVAADAAYTRGQLDVVLRQLDFLMERAAPGDARGDRGR